MMECQVVTLSLSEDDLFRLPDYVDELQQSNQDFKNDGVLIFDVADGSGERTTLNDFITNYGDELVESLKRLNPINVPQSKEFYGHMSFSHKVLDEKVISTCGSVLKDPLQYSESPDNCCISSLNENGVAGLLSHYFEMELPAQAKLPPQCQQIKSLKSASKKAASRSASFKKLKSTMDSGSASIKAAEVSRVLEMLKHKKQELHGLNPCTCWMCVASDEVLMEDDENELGPNLRQTEQYYRGKGFMYANGVNVPSINSPYLYFGLIHSFFPIHIEDLSLWSVNFLHYGYPKVWIVVPPSAIAKLHFFISKEFTCPGHSSCIGLLGHKYHVPTPSWLSRYGIPFKVAVQRSGQGVIVAPNAAHFGFNLGPNVAEAINFGSISWIPYGIVYPKCTCMIGQVHADLSTVISTFSPEMLRAYLHQKVPRVTSQPEFYKSIVHPYLWKEAFDDGDESRQQNDGDNSSADKCDGGNADAASPVPPKRHTKSHRKVVMCPVCEVVYQGGQKQRLLNHIQAAHPNLPDNEKSRVDDLIGAMFPQRGFKLPKRACEKCGKSVARSMNAHQSSSACTQLNLTSQSSSQS